MTRSTRILHPLFLLSLLLLLPPAGAVAQEPAASSGSTPQVVEERRYRLTASPDSRLWVDGTSTLRDFSCEAGRMDVTVVLGSPPSGLDASEVAGAVEDASAAVPALRLDCGNDTMNKHMRNALKVEYVSTIRFRLARHAVAAAAGDSATVEMSGNLTLAGVERALPLVVTLRRESGDTLRVTGGVDLDMTDFDVEPPSLFFGTLNVGRRVEVLFDVLLTPEPETDPAPDGT